MIRRSRANRLAWFAAAILQLLVPTVWSVADARAEAVSERTATEHIESTGTKDCARVHPADCVVCRVIATPSAPSAPATVAVPIDEVIGRRPPEAALRGPSARAPGDPPQRAPPV
jgi:hypothetical protein